jgi:hypothetical protein
MQQIHHLSYGFVLVLLFVLLIPLNALFYARYLRLSAGRIAVLLVAASIVSASIGILPELTPTRGFEIYAPPYQAFLGMGARILLPFAAIAFLAKLYLVWIAGAATDAEKAPGREGIRAWLRAGNLYCAVLTSLCLWLDFGYSFWAAITLALMALLAYPVLNMGADTTAPQTAAPAGDALAPERERVLKMLDDGKITAPESAELLNALAHSAPAHAPQTAPSPHRKMVWLGAALLVVGFLLPWFAINPARVENDLLSQVPLLGRAFAPTPQLALPMVYIAAGDIEHGLGWWVLALGITAAALPFVAGNLDSQTCQKVSLVALGIGAIILGYVLTQGARYAGIGILLGLAGYALEIVGALKARRLDWGRAMQ